MKDSRPSIPLAETAAIGVAAGLLYFAACAALMFPSEQLALMGSAFLKFNVFAYTAAFWVVFFTALAAVLRLVTFPLVALARARWAVVAARMVTFFAVAAVFTAGFAVWTYYISSAPLMPRYVLMADIRNVLSLIALASGAFAFGMGFIVTFGPAGAGAWVRRQGRLLAGIIVGCAAYVALVNLAVPLVTSAGPGGGRNQASAVEPSRRVVVLGIDAGTWNAALPYIEAGDLPAMKHMMDTGSCGYLATYGHQFTPMVWTSIATGKTVSKHGVRHFGNLSTDWKAAPIWSIVSGAGMKAGVVNWVCTWPPFEVDGGFVSKIIAPQADRTYFSPEFAYLKPAADSIISRWGYEVPRDDAARVAYAEHEAAYLWRLDADVMTQVAPDFVAYYYYSPDMVEHFFWKDMDPGMLAGTDWAGTTANPHDANIIRDAYIASDRLLAGLMERYGPGAAYFVLSDHGMRPITRRMATFRMNALLEALGYVTLVGGEVDRSVSICYEMEGPPHFRFDLKINPSAYSEGGEDYAALRDRIAGRIMGLSISETGRPVFARVEEAAAPAPGDEPDLVVYASEALLDLASRDKHIAVGEKQVALSDLLIPHPWSGKHRARGMLLASGPAIRHAYTGAWIMDDPYTSVFRYVYGIFSLPTRLAPVLRALHLIDAATTLDPTPTFLYLLGLPVGEDMDGRILEELITGEFWRENPVEIAPPYRMGSVSNVEGGVDQAELKERLKALGYIQ
jgi:predicted AlkP superfamily phosphohydrolase/phosphomutase